MTPVGHMAVSYLVSRALGTRVSRTGCLLGGILPDADFILLPFPFFNAFHRVISHNVFFVTLGAAVGSQLVSGQRRRFFFSVLLCGLLHILIDSIMDTNPTNGIGVAFFWPLSDCVWSPFNLFTPDPDAAGWSDLSGSLMRNLPYMLMELPLWGVALVLLYLERLNSGGSSGGVQWAETEPQGE